ncbi:TRAP transporter permease [Chloroflexota bacterium]
MSAEPKGQRLKGRARLLYRIIGALVVVYALLYVMDLFLDVGIYIWPMSYISSFSGLFMILVFLAVPAKKGATGGVPWYDIVFCVLTAIGFFYVSYYYPQINLRAGLANPLEIVLGIMTLILILEAIRRTIGLVVVIIVGLFIIYPFVCHLLPGIFEGKSYGLERSIGYMYLYTDGIFGVIAHIIATLVVVFILFANFLYVGGAGKFITNMAFSMFGHVRGGPAKAAVFASAGFGSISGSALGNVTTTGMITIPMMKSIGYKPEFAGAVEAVASSGGAILPPVMGVVAFIMADFLGVSYATVALAAAVPAILYYLSLFMQVDFEAAKLGLHGLPKKELPPFWKSLAGGWYLLIPLAVLIYYLFIVRFWAVTACLYALAALIITSMIKKDTRIGPRKIIEGIEGCSRAMLMLVPVGLGVGIIMGVVMLTGVGMRLSQSLVVISGGNPIILLILAAITCAILGMGLPWTACYILLALLVVPGVIAGGIDPMAAHLFILYTGIFAYITPPVCVVAYAAAAIADSKPMTTGFFSMRLGVVAYLVPFFFALNPALILHGPVFTIVTAVITGIIGVVALAAAMEGYLLKHCTPLERIIFAIGGILMMAPQAMTDIIGMALVAFMVIWQWLAFKRAKLAVPIELAETPSHLLSDSKEDTS